MRRPGELAICLVLLLAGVPAAAAADWTEPRPVADERAQAPLVPPLAVNERGEAVVAWVEAAGVRIATRRAGASNFARAVTVPGSAGAGEPLVAINARGDVVVGWRAFDRVCGCPAVGASARRAGARFPRGRTVSLRGEGAEGHSVAIGPGGTAAVSWRSGAGVEASFARRGGTFGRAVAIGRYERGYQAALVIDGRDRATAFWRVGSRHLERLRYARRDPSGAVSRGRTAAAPGEETSGFEFWDFAAATDLAGRHVLAWTRHADFGPDRIEVAVGDRSGRFGPRQTLATAGTDLGSRLSGHHLGVAPNGVAAVAWARGEANTTRAELALRRSADSDFTVRTVPGSDAAYAPRVAIARSGRTALAWSGAGGVVATVGDGAGNLAEPRRFPGSNPAVGIDRDGDALVVWHTSGGLVFSDFRSGS